MLQSDVHICEIAERQSLANNLSDKGDAFRSKPQLDAMFLDEAYERCRKICAEYAKTYYLGTLLLTKERQKAIWAVYAWCKRTDELVDGPNAFCVSPAALDRWKRDYKISSMGTLMTFLMLHLLILFPSSIYTSRYFKPFRDMIKGMRMDTEKCRYANFQELYLYCYYAGGTVGLMSVPVMGMDPDSSASAQSIYNAALYLGIGNQLTNILRDVGEDASRGRIYLPQDELAKFGLRDEDIFSRKVSDEWREFMKEQITRARYFYKLAEEGASELDKASRWPVWTVLILYQKILDAIQDNDYDNLTKRAYVGNIKKLFLVRQAYYRAQSISTATD
ncbi:hypothetical protein KPL70_002312 [Citrus sinensis]|nr:hypothetical protein KPL70_002312 [Citrus sinensis]